MGCTEGHTISARNQLSQCAAVGTVSTVVDIPAGEYQVGQNGYYAEEQPVGSVTIAPFNIDATEVTNASFRAFVEATGYVTRAERGLPEVQYETLPDEVRQPGSAVFSPPKPNSTRAAWWTFVPGANWKVPLGPGSNIAGLHHHPVVHIALEDAQAYADWRGRRLPTEAEWETAARGGLVGAPYAWGDKPPAELEMPHANIWQGLFPVVNEMRDGFEGTSPVGCFPANGYGLYDMIGNVWEWTADPYYPDRTMIDRKGSKSKGFDPAQPGITVGVLKGGSYLCSDNFCRRYRPSARQSQDLTFSASHIGFRTVSFQRDQTGILE